MALWPPPQECRLGKNCKCLVWNRGSAKSLPDLVLLSLRPLGLCSQCSVRGARSGGPGLVWPLHSLGRWTPFSRNHGCSACPPASSLSRPTPLFPRPRLCALVLCPCPAPRAQPLAVLCGALSMLVGRQRSPGRKNSHSLGCSPLCEQVTERLKVVKQRSQSHPAGPVGVGPMLLSPQGPHADLLSLPLPPLPQGPSVKISAAGRPGSRWPNPRSSPGREAPRPRQGRPGIGFELSPGAREGDVLLWGWDTEPKCSRVGGRHGDMGRRPPWPPRVGSGPPGFPDSGPPQVPAHGARGRMRAAAALSPRAPPSKGGLCPSWHQVLGSGRSRAPERGWLSCLPSPLSLPGAQGPALPAAAEVAACDVTVSRRWTVTSWPVVGISSQAARS